MYTVYQLPHKMAANTVAMGEETELRTNYADADKKKKSLIIMASIVPVSMVAALVCRVLFAVLSVINIFGNTLVILSVARLRSMHTAMNYLLVNLAVSDGLVAIFLLPRYVFNDMLHYPKDVRADIMCKFFTHGTISWVGLHAGVFTLIAISFERYGAVVHPHSIRGRLTKSKLKLVLVACWLYAVGFIMPDFVKTNSCCREIDQLKPIMEMTAKGHGFKLQDHLTVIVDKEARQERIDEGRNVLTAAKIKRKRRRKKKQNYDINLEQ
ncbi:hypothetical protein QZH41_002355 [Actinostola sp. cb2023]|nr:hypothetical protein QZH41_002355 [Actinostola sp. cb2023]